MVYAADFHSLDMIDLVTQQSTLSLLRNAEAQAAEGNYTEALALLSEAFEDVLIDYADRKRAADHSSPYDLWPPQVHTRVMLGRDHDPQLTNRVEQIEDALDRVQQAIRVLAMGLDYRRYARFELLVPTVMRFMDGHRDVRPIPGLHVGDEEYQFCKQFVIEAALHLAEMDFDLDVYSL